ncbi:uncharacterized protein FFB20_11456 [Fusarium fujikuroi]|nr:uncharacterized protein FPRN_02345 [Fusarium proliferatum]SCN90311.1 uncharacterized protein FFE2_06928 [Fusarium fujikuroi]SCN98767.1 uncharacterized protein FFM5_06962 [Fusarium fujikuroi]SCO01648.1 uncharacterized protein FFB20_11456 [Fusarium fujikuroi]SCO18937.1 uncharacterized protein FFC1_13384 [Fusarium fujikuroi]
MRPSHGPPAYPAQFTLPGNDTKSAVHPQPACRRLNLAVPAFQPPPFPLRHVDKPPGHHQTAASCKCPAVCHTFGKPPVRDPGSHKPRSVAVECPECPTWASTGVQPSF